MKRLEEKYSMLQTIDDFCELSKTGKGYIMNMNGLVPFSICLDTTGKIIFLATENIEISQTHVLVGSNTRIN